MEGEQMQSPVKSKKILYLIVGGVVVLLVLGFLGSRMMGLGTRGNISYGPNGTQTYSNNEGQVTVGQNVGMPSEWPSDAPANYQGATIVFSGNSNPQTGKAGAAVSYTLQNTTVKAVADYYQAQFTAKGWTVEGNANFGPQTVIGAKKDGRTFAVSIVDTGSGAITVTAGLELE